MAASRTTLRSDLQLVLDNFTQLRNAYLALKAFSKIQDELLQYEKTKSSKMEAEMKKLTMTYSSLEEQRKKTIDELCKEKEVLKTALVESQQECDHFRFVYVDRSIENEQIRRLQDELEVVKANLALQEEKHQEEISKLKKNHSEELQKYKIMLDFRHQHETKTLNHPALMETPTQRRATVKNKKTKQKANASFKWPSLDVSKTTEAIGKYVRDNIKNDTLTAITRKKKKLYCVDREEIVDV